MDPATPAQLATAAVIVIAACIALFGTRRLVSVVAFLVLGATASLYWALLGAADVALAEAAIGTGVTGALLIAAVTATHEHNRVQPGGPVVLVLSIASGLAVGALCALALARAAVATSPAGPGLTAAVDGALAETRVTHPVTGVLLNLRSFDTLLELVVLLTAVAIALAFLPRPSREVPVEPGPESGIILDRFTRVVAPIVLLLAAWLLFAGSSRPGGAFQAGAALAATLILLRLSGVHRIRLGSTLRTALVAGLGAFVLVGAGGVVAGGAWLELRGSVAGPVTVILETVLAVTIGASLATLFLAVGRARHPTAARGRPGSCGP